MPIKRKYYYDVNYNMTTRMVGGTTYILTYDAENRLTGVTWGGHSAAFTYDGDGSRIKASFTISGVTRSTTYIGNYFEWKTNTGDMVKNYYAGSQLIANRQGANARVVLLSDQLGSTTLAMQDGWVIGETRYKPWGEARSPSGSMPTDRHFTGQIEEPDLGLYFYNARWYDSALGRFIQADTIIPDLFSPGSYDRFAYTMNNPVNFNDPTGHDQDCGSTETECKKIVQNEKESSGNLEAYKTQLLTVLDKSNNGDLLASLDLILPTHIGIRFQFELSIPFPTGPQGINLALGENIIWNFRQGKVASNIDFSVEPGVGIGGGASSTIGPLIGWFSSDVKDVTSGYSTTGGFSGAAGVAAVFSASVPQKGVDPTVEHYLDPHFGVYPITYYLGLGAGALYGGGNLGVSSTIPINGKESINITNLFH